MLLVDPTTMCCCLKIEVDTKKLSRYIQVQTLELVRKIQFQHFLKSRENFLQCGFCINFPYPYFTTSSINPSKKSHLL